MPKVTQRIANYNLTSNNASGSLNWVSRRGGGQYTDSLAAKAVAWLIIDKSVPGPYNIDPTADIPDLTGNGHNLTGDYGIINPPSPGHLQDLGNLHPGSFTSLRCRCFD